MYIYINKFRWNRNVNRCKRVLVSHHVGFVSIFNCTINNGALDVSSIDKIVFLYAVPSRYQWLSDISGNFNAKFIFFIVYRKD